VRVKHTDREALALGRNEDPRHDAAEIDAVVSLLRSLPDPEPSSDLTARIMRRVAEVESRPRLVRAFFGRPSTSNVAAALAAGIACAAVGLHLQPPTPPGPAPLRVAKVGPSDSRPLGPAFEPRAVQFSGSPPEALPVLPTAGSQSASLLDRRLDVQLNELQLDPHAFFRRLERVQERDRFVHRLAERAARRGDAAQVALNVRTVSHPLAQPVVDELLHASLIRQVSTATR
jgi:hypothetical protein